MSRLRQYVNKMMGSCESCKHDGKTPLEWPCVNCVNNVKDHFEEKTNGWIPCSERMPEREKDVLVSFGDETFVIAWYDEKDDQWKNSSTGFVINSVIWAWMPLPDPYSEEEQHDK